MLIMRTECLAWNKMSCVRPAAMIQARDLMMDRIPPMIMRSLRPWSWMNLPSKVSLVILLNVGLSALSGEYLDRGYVCDLARQNFQEELTAVVRQIGGDITGAAELANTGSRQMELDRLMANRPDLIDVAIYVFSAEQPARPTLLANAGNTTMPGLD